MLRHRETAAPGVGRVVHVSRKPPSQCTITLTPRHGKIALALLILGAVAYLVVSRSRLVWPRQYGVSELKKEYPTTPTVALLAVPEYNASGAPFFTRLSTSISWGAAAIEPSTAVGIPYIIHRPQEGEFLRIMNLIWAAAGASTHVQSTVLEPPYTDERLLSTLLVAGHQAYGHGADYITIVKEAYWDVGFAMIPSIPSSVPQEQVRLGFLSDADGPYYLALHRNDWLEFADLLTQAPPSHWKELIIARYLVRSAARDLANRLSSPYMHFLSTEAFWRNLRTPDTTSAQQFAEFSSKALTLGSERSHTSFFIVMYCSSEDQLFSIAVAAEQWASLGLKLYILTTPGTSCDRHGKDVPAPAVHLPVDIGFSTHFLINHLLDQGGIMAEEVDTLLSLAFVPLLVQGGKLSPQDNVLVVDAATVVSMGEFVPLEVLALDPARRWKVFNVRSSSTPCVGWPLLATAQEWSALVGELFPGALQSVLKDVLQSLQSSPVDATFRFRDKVVIHLIWPYSQSALCQVVTYPLSKSEEAAEQAGADDAGAAPTTKVSLCTAMLDRDPLEAGNAANSALFKYLGQSLSGAATDKAIELSVYAAVDAGPYGVAKRSLEAAAQEWYTLTQGSIPLRWVPTQLPSGPSASDACMAAYGDGAEYLFAVPETVSFQSPNVVRTLVDALQQQRDRGVVTPMLLQAAGATEDTGLPFVHRDHCSAFGYFAPAFMPPSFVWPWMAGVYGPKDSQIINSTEVWASFPQSPVPCNLNAEIRRGTRQLAASTVHVAVPVDPPSDYE